MADIRKAISLISGGEATPQQVQRVQALAHSLDIPNNDPLLPILIALDCYHGVFSELPEKNRIAANEAANAAADMSGRVVKQHVDRVMADTVLAVAPTMKAAMEKVADAASQNAKAKVAAQWIIGALGATVVVVIGSLWFGHNWGYSTGKAEAVTAAAWMTTPAGQAAYAAYQADPVAAEWAGTRAAQVAYKLSKTDDLVAIATCDRKGWKKEAQMNGSTICVPRQAKDGLYGWTIPQ